MDEKAFRELVDEIARHGFDRATASHYAELIGDTPIVQHGLVIVMEGGHVLARLKLSIADEP